jgi:WD40 repeat protein/DNA-binding SARP family transcriptional activator
LLQVRLLGQFDVQADGKRVHIPSRAGQSLLAYLLLSAGTAHRREKLAGLLSPDVSDENARRNLRQELWRIRKAISSQQPSGPEYLLADDITIAFNAEGEYWLDVAGLERAVPVEASAGELIHQVSLYRGELLPGFYDDWVVLERERIQALFESRIQKLLERLIAEQRWVPVLESAERWIALGQTPEPAYRALMAAYAALGDRAKVAYTLERCRAMLVQELDVEPSSETQTLYEQLMRGESATRVDLTSAQVAPAQLRKWDEPPLPGDAPFKGLQYFEEMDAELFFGRELLTAQLVGRLRDYPFLAVVLGASGSGKSSIVRAGLIPALKRGAVLADGTLPPEGSEEWHTHIITPTAHPLEALAISLTCNSESVTAAATLLDDLARDPRSLHLYVKRQIAGAPSSVRGIRYLLVVDQFEELFTLCQDEFEREAFIDDLLIATAPELNGPTTVVMTIRADFYSHLAQYENLREVVSRHQEFIGPMRPDELHRAIEGPAFRGGWEFEPGLVDLILRDAGDAPGALPLVSHALLETWKRRSGRTLTLKGYNDAGGVRGAIAQTAELVYQALTPAEQAIARNIFLRLTELGEGTEDTRRRAAIAELIPGPEETASVRAVLTRLADARLITLGQDSAEVAHEALIREWPALREWLSQDRESLVLHRRLTLAAQEWELLERDAGALYRSSRLAQVNEWAAAHAERLNETERAFLLASDEREQEEEAEREAQRQRELLVARQMAATAQKLAETETRRAEEQTQTAARLRRRSVALGVAFLLATVLASIALFLGDRARTSASIAEANARAESIAKADALGQQRVATSRELAALAVSNLNLDPQQSLLLALEAVSVTYTVDKTWTSEAENALHQAVQAARAPLTLAGHNKEVTSAVFSPDGKYIASTGYDATKVWDASTGKELLSLPGIKPTFFAAFAMPAAFSPDSRRLATLDADDTRTSFAKIWDLTSGKLVHNTSLFISPGEITDIAFSPDLSRLATSEVDGSARIWDMTTGQLLEDLSSDCTMSCDIEFSLDGAHLATDNPSNNVRIWDVANGKQVAELANTASTSMGLRGHSVAFSPDGVHVAASYTDGTAGVWDLTTHKEIVKLAGSTFLGFSITFSPDGKRVAVGSFDNRAIVWDVTNGRELYALAGHNGSVNSVAFSPDGQRLVTASDDKTVKIWNLAPSGEALKVKMEPITAFAASADGRRFATSQSDNTVKVWDTTTGRLIWTLPGHTSPVHGMAFNHGGTRLATGDSDGTVKVWSLTTGDQLLTFVAHRGGVNGIAFSPDSTRLATASSDTTAKIWDTASGKELLTLEGLAGSVNNASFSPDGTRLATAHSIGLVKVWDVMTGRLLAYERGHASAVWDVQFSPDGKRMVSAGQDATARVIDAGAARGISILFEHAGSVTHAVFSADGLKIATASDDGNARIWDAATGQEQLALFGHTGPLNGVAFSPDGSRLITSSEDGTVQVYLLRIDDLLQVARSRLTRTWTAAECQDFLHTDHCPAPP